MIASFLDPVAVLDRVFAIKGADYLMGNSWAQTAVAFGMHSYADFACGREMMAYGDSSKKGNVPATITYWNSTLFMIRWIWVLVLAKGLFHLHGGLSFLSDCPLGVGLIVILALDAIICRPLAVWAQRRLNDASPPIKDTERREWEALTVTQKCCRMVFFYEAILSGCSGAAYLILPSTFILMYFPNVRGLGLSVSLGNLFDVTSSSFVVNFCFMQFGVNVLAFGLYQMSANIDERNDFVIWWLLLDFVWMFFYYLGVKHVHGPWNPLMLTGANIMCHIAFHADSTLALARMAWLAVESTQTTKKGLWTRFQLSASGRPSLRSSSSKKRK